MTQNTWQDYVASSSPGSSLSLKGPSLLAIFPVRRNHTFLTMISTLFVLCSIINSSGIASESRDLPAMPPAFDGDIGKGKPALRLSSNRAFIEGRQVEHVTDGIETRGPVIKSKQVNLAVEYWDGNGIQVIIDRRFFEFEEDAINFPSSGLFFTNAVFPGWDKKPSWAPTEKIGDKTSWLYPSMLYFVKGKVFVTITVMPPDLGVKYTDNIARNIEKKL